MAPNENQDRSFGQSRCGPAYYETISELTDINSLAKSYTDFTCSELRQLKLHWQLPEVRTRLADPDHSSHLSLGISTKRLRADPVWIVLLRAMLDYVPVQSQKGNHTRHTLRYPVRWAGLADSLESGLAELVGLESNML